MGVGKKGEESPQHENFIFSEEFYNWKVKEREYELEGQSFSMWRTLKGVEVSEETFKT